MKAEIILVIIKATVTKYGFSLNLYQYASRDAPYKSFSEVLVLRVRSIAIFTICVNMRTLLEVDILNS